MSRWQFEARLRTRKNPRAAIPAIIDRVASGQLHQSGIVVLGRYLADDNRQELLAEAGGKARRLVADRAPKPSVPSSIRRLPTAKTAASSPSLFAETQARPASPAESASLPTRPPRRPVERPPPALGADRFKVGFTASGRLVGKTERLKALVSHAVPTGARDEVFERAIDLAIEAVERRRFLELDHIEPFGAGGRHVASDIRLRCRGHDLRAAVEHCGQHAIDVHIHAPGPIRVDGRGGR